MKVQTWGDDLRLPCFIHTADLLKEVEHLRRPSIPFQSKYLPALKRNKWFVLRRPADKSRAGLVVISPEQKCCFYVSGEPVSPKRPTPRVALLRVRIDPQLLSDGAGLTVFAATLSPSLRRIYIEDTVVWKGRNVFAEESFSERWARAVQWIEHYCILDPRLLGGIEIEMAKWTALSSLRPDGVWELQSDEAGSKRFLWIANRELPSPSLDESPPVSVPKLEIGPLVAVATRESGPEQWSLASADGVDLGRALVRTLAVSECLRSTKSRIVRVEVVWNAIFNKWEVKAMSDSLASHSGNFGASK